jgi:hypothetical protein
LDALKQRIKAALPEGSIVAAAATLRGDGRLDQSYLEHVAEQITTKLKAAVGRHITAIEKMEQAPNFALERERREHQEFYADKLKVFIGRARNLDDIKSYLGGSADHPLVLHGPSGAGKSALMAKAISRADKPEGPPVVYRFIGASAESSNFRPLFVSLIEELVHRRIATQPSSLEDDPNKFADQIRTLLTSLSEPAVIFLDALDQIRSYRPIWLPPKLPTGVKLIVSVLNDRNYKQDSGIYEDLHNRLPEEAFLEIETLQAADGREILIALEGQERPAAAAILPPSGAAGGARSAL